MFWPQRIQLCRRSISPLLHTSAQCALTRQIMSRLNRAARARLALRSRVTNLKGKDGWLLASEHEHNNAGDWARSSVPNLDMPYIILVTKIRNENTRKKIFLNAKIRLVRKKIIFSSSLNIPGEQLGWGRLVTKQRKYIAEGVLKCQHVFFFISLLLSVVDAMNTQNKLWFFTVWQVDR